MRSVTVLAIASALVGIQAIIPASANDETRHETQQPTAGQEHAERSSNTEKSSNITANQPPKIGHVGKDQAQPFRFGGGSRF